MSQLLRVIVASSLVVLAVCLNEKKEIQVPLGRTTIVQNPDYPQTSPEPTTSLQWTLVSPPATTITLECPDIRISPTENCDKGYLMITHSDNEKTAPYCGTASGLKITSTNNKLILHFELIWAAGVFNCKAEAEPSRNPSGTAQKEKPILNGEKIDLRVGEVRYHDINLNPMPRIEKTYHWEITTQPGYKIGIRCPVLWMGNYYVGSECDEGYFRFGLGNEDIKICNSSNQLNLVSSGNKLELTVKTNRRAMAGIHCIFLSTKGPHFEEYKNLPEFEKEDSSEYGHPQIKGAKSTTCECGLANKPPSRILHGDYVAAHEFPWMAGLLESAQSLQTFCGGTIVTRWHVISAAHCTLAHTATHVIVGMDHMWKREGGKIYAVEKVINHDYINNYASSKDISLLIMAEEIQFGHNVGAACMPTRDPNIINQRVVAVGWGAIAADESGKTDYDQLKKAKLRVISMDACNPIWDGRWPVYPQTHICTWNRRQDVCFGDSGGPVVWLDPETNRYTLVGIPSACDGCRLEKPSLHTALHYYYPWVLDNMRNNNHGDEKLCTKID
uniref:Venom s1 protease with cub domain 14 n=1 Tax=Pristhesancus plagipennis TaxID=1955184 RepID=A0A1Q1NPK0_PRIPG|nr:venom s1 protease with cub domain 14 [Pristhesancus plagipennis]